MDNVEVAYALHRVGERKLYGVRRNRAFQASLSIARGLVDSRDAARAITGRRYAEPSVPPAQAYRGAMTCPTATVTVKAWLGRRSKGEFRRALYNAGAVDVLTLDESGVAPRRLAVATVSVPLALAGTMRQKLSAWCI